MHLCNHWWIFEFYYVWTNDINIFSLFICIWQILMLEETDSPFFYMKVIGLENLKSIRKDLIQWFSWNYKQLQSRLFLTWYFICLMFIDAGRAVLAQDQEDQGSPWWQETGLQCWACYRRPSVGLCQQIPVGHHCKSTAGTL